MHRYEISSVMWLHIIQSLLVCVCGVLGAGCTVHWIICRHMTELIS
jgi:hypothetical protein